MIRRRLWHIKDKWKRHLALVPNRKVARHIPPTKLLGRKSLRDYMERYNVLFVKPVFGSFGNNILKVSKKNGVYQVQEERRIQHLPRGQAEARIMRHAGGRAYLVQKGVPLLRIKGKPLDFRLLLLRPGMKWRVMGIMGKVAGGNRAVTNFNHGGSPIGFEEALRSAGLRRQQISEARSEMLRIGTAAAETFSARYKHCRRMGIDFAVDMGGRVWIIEVNTNPYYDLFRHHKDRSLHGRIDRIMKQIRQNQSSR